MNRLTETYVFIFSALFLCTGLYAQVGVTKLGPYNISMQKVEISIPPQASALFVDYHEVFGCSGDSNYQRSKLNQNEYFVKISPHDVPGLTCKTKTVYKNASVIFIDELSPSSSVTLWINDQRSRPEPRSVYFVDESGEQLSSSAMDSTFRPFQLFRLYDTWGSAFSADLVVNGSCALFQHPLNFTYDGVTEFPSQDKIIFKQNTKPCGLNGTTTTSLPLVFTNEDTPGFRSIAIYVEKVDGANLQL